MKPHRIHRYGEQHTQLYHNEFFIEGCHDFLLPRKEGNINKEK
jgi:hypothetical protein